MVEEGVTDLDDILRDRLASQKLERDHVRSALECCGRAMRENITTGDIPFRKEWMRSIIQRIEVDDEAVRIIGDKSTLEQAVDGKPEASGGVRRCVPRWHAQRESNPCLHRERVMS